MSKSQDTDATGFDRFALDPALSRALREARFFEPRRIQTEAIPAALEGADVLGLAPTGTGKTAAFALPLLERLLHKQNANPRALVLAPTRELAAQIAAEIRLLARFTRVKTALVFGGVSIHSQIDALRRKPEIVVACPGRLIDLMQRRDVRLDAIEILVIDEVDHMFDLGFLPGIRRILSELPAVRQNLLFSATMPREIRRLAEEVLVRPRIVDIAGAAPAETIDHALFPVADERKRHLLEHILASDGCKPAIVFTRTKHRARRIAQQLVKVGHRAVGLQGNMSQGQRDRAMSGFRSRRYDILVATDIAARGIDVSGVSHVINYDVPSTPEAYTHRIGRTGRSECTGTASTFVAGDDWSWVRATERMIGARIPRRQIEQLTEADESCEAPTTPTERQRHRTRRPTRTHSEPARPGRRDRRWRGSARRRAR